MGISKMREGLLLWVITVLLITSNPAKGLTYDWPVVVNRTGGEPQKAPITSTMAEPRENGTRRDHFHWGVDMDDNALVQRTGKYPIYVKAIADGKLLAVSDDAECIKYSKYRYCHVDFVNKFRPGDEVDAGDVFARFKDVEGDIDNDGIVEHPLVCLELSDRTKVNDLIFE